MTKADEFLKLDSLINDPDVNKAIEENALTEDPQTFSYEVKEEVTTIKELEKSVEEMYDADNLIEPPDAYLYESPDGGKTIYRRKSGSSEREIVEDV